jgi:HD-GYP domain-containing protein (c-di-GMP phosphodiesterase class II)
MLNALAGILAARDPATAAHALRVKHLAVAVTREACVGDDVLIAAIHAAAPLHDIGKLGVPDSLLNKPGPLSADEYDLVKRHASMGADILAGLERGGPLARIVRHHHESWDGSGYPDALHGAAIPIGARILAVVDCYDALTSERPYRQPLSHATAMEMLAAGRGTVYDPAILDAFFRVVRRLRSSTRLTLAASRRPLTPSFSR